MKDDRRLVYSTDGTMPLPDFKTPRKPSQQPQRPHVPDDGVVRVSRERRRGSIVTAITGLPERSLAETAKNLKKLCGSGGTAKNGIVEIQGDHREKIVAQLQTQGYTVKKAGG